jgi:predicted Zn finger-like uncharacterized protein
MTRITTCPRCNTRFRVTAAQLAARKGDVRCGRCSHVFNAYETLAEETPEAELRPDVEAPQPATPHEETSRPSPAVAVNEAEASSLPMEANNALPEEPLIDFQVDAFPDIESSEEAAAPLQWPQTESPPQPEAEPAAQPEAGPPAPEPEPTAKVRVVRIQPPPLAIETRVSPDSPKYGPPPKPRRAWPWVLASLLLLAALTGQVIYFLRDSIAANYPPTRAMLEQACRQLNCRISLPQNPDLLSIESSELHADPTRPNIVVLTSTLRNHAAYVQSYPTLELTLTNTKDEMVARRLILPREYVRQTSSVRQGIPAKGDVAVKLLMDLGDLKAEGYRLYLFYPS